MTIRLYVNTKPSPMQTTFTRLEPALLMAKAWRGQGVGVQLFNGGTIEYIYNPDNHVVSGRHSAGVSRSTGVKRR